MNAKTKIFTALVLFLLLSPAAFALDNNENVCAVYFTGIGCSHCARADPVVLGTLPKTTNLIVIEYEIYRDAINSRLMTGYNDNYNTGFGVPLIILNNDKFIRGDSPIITQLKGTVNELGSNNCPLADGTSLSFEDLDITSLPGKPKIWKGERILMAVNGTGDSNVLKNLLTTDNPLKALESIDYELIEPKAVPLSGTEVTFDNAVKISGWIFQWNGKGFDNVDKTNNANANNDAVADSIARDKIKLSTLCIIALADTINPCALAVFILMLIGITTYDPGNRKKRVLYAGLSFVTAVYIMYFFYGLIIIRSIQLVEAITNIRPILTTIFGTVAILLGLLHLKEVLWYRPGGMLTEMPMSWRPRVKKLMTSITSPKGAFFMGAFVTVFLIPCTMGPYFIAGGILSVLELIETIPWLLIYDFVFILPLIAITFIIHFGFKQVEDVSGWKEKNIKNIHLFTAIIMLFVGLGILFGWI